MSWSEKLVGYAYKKTRLTRLNIFCIVYLTPDNNSYSHCIHVLYDDRMTGHDELALLALVLYLRIRISILLSLDRAGEG